MKTLRLCGTIVFMMAPATFAVGYIDILPGSHNNLITRVTYEVDGEIVVQDAPAVGVSVNRNGEVFLKSVTVKDGATTRVLESHSSMSAEVTNIALTPATKGVGVFNNGVITRTSDIPSFAGALAATFQDTDLLNYSFYDFVNGMPGVGVADYDLLFQRSFEPTDYVLVAERWGNSYFTLTALDEGGEVITGTNTLRFGYPTGDAYMNYDWNSGYASSSYVTNQAMAFTVTSISKFFEGTTVNPREVSGFRVDNDGEADVKILGLSNIPEPSSAFLTAVGALACAIRRKR